MWLTGVYSCCRDLVGACLAVVRPPSGACAVIFIHSFIVGARGRAGGGGRRGLAGRASAVPKCRSGRVGGCDVITKEGRGLNLLAPARTYLSHELCVKECMT